MPDQERDDLEPRVRALEGQMAEVRPDAAVARILASGADRDVSEVRAELRAHLGAINALGAAQRETRMELKAEIAELRAETRAGFATVQAGFVAVQAGMSRLADLLQRPEG